MLIFTGTLAQINSVGFFDSTAKFRNIAKTEPRCVMYYELELFEKPGGTCFIDGNSYEIKKNMLLLARPGQTRYSILPFTCYFLKLEKSNSRIFEFFDNEPFIVSDTFFAKAKKLIRQIAAYTDSDEKDDELYAECRVLELFCALKLELEHRHGGTHRDAQLTPAIEEALYFMEQNCTRQLSLNEIAAAANLSPVYFHQRFVKVFGTTPHDYLLRLRLNRVKLRLAMSATPISQIAYEAGFSSQSYFNYAFKRETGMTPLQYRKSRHSQYEL